MCSILIHTTTYIFLSTMWFEPKRVYNIKCSISHVKFGILTKYLTIMHYCVLKIYMQKKDM